MHLAGCNVAGLGLLTNLTLGVDSQHGHAPALHHGVPPSAAAAPATPRHAAASSSGAVSGRNLVYAGLSDCSSLCSDLLHDGAFRSSRSNSRFDVWAVTGCHAHICKCSFRQELADVLNSDAGSLIRRVCEHAKSKRVFATRDWPFCPPWPVRSRLPRRVGGCAARTCNLCTCHNLARLHLVSASLRPVLKWGVCLLDGPAAADRESDRNAMRSTLPKIQQTSDCKGKRFKSSTKRLYLLD